MSKEEKVASVLNMASSICKCGMFTTEVDSNEKLSITRVQLDEGEFIKGNVKKTAIVLHHTAGRHNPLKTVQHWNGDARGRIATHYVIGGISCDGSDKSSDGVVVQCMDHKDWAWHLGALGSAGNSKSIGIEICSAGGLKDGKTWFEAPVSDDQIFSLDRKFRGYSQFHKYSDNQVINTVKLIQRIAKAEGVDVSKGLPAKLKKLKEEGKDLRSAFNFDRNINADNIEGIVSHTNVRSGKSDVYPDDRLIEALLMLA